MHLDQPKPPTCPRCNGATLVLVRTPDQLSLAGYVQVAKDCPECRPRPAVSLVPIVQTFCAHCDQPIEKKTFPHAWLHLDGWLYCASKPLSTRATPRQEAA